MFRFSSRATFESYVVLCFLIVLALSVQSSPGEELIPSPDLVRLVLVLGLVAMALVLSGGRLPRPSMLPLLAVLLLGGFFVWSLVTAYSGGEYMGDSVRRAFLGVGVSWLILLSVLIMNPSTGLAWRLAGVFIVVSTAISVLGLVISGFGGGYVPSGHGTYFQTLAIGGGQLVQEVHMAGGFPRISSVTGNPNTLGFFSGLACLFIAIGVFLGRGRLLSASVPFAINFAALFHSFSRGSMLALFLALVLVAWISNPRKALLYSVVFGLCLLVLSPLYVGSLSSMVEARADSGMQGRDQIWINALEKVKDRPVMGVGFGLETERIHEPAGIKWTMHNAYLVVLSETGVVGLGLLFAFLLMVLSILLLSIFRSREERIRSVLMLTLGVALFVLIRSAVETSVFRFTNVNLIFMIFVSLGLVLSQPSMSRLESGSIYGSKRKPAVDLG